MGRLIIWIFWGVALFSGYWFVASHVAQTRLQDAIADARAEGWQVEVADQNMTGFPGMFALQFATPSVVDPTTQWAWSGESMEVSTPSINPTKPTVVFPTTQTLRIGEQTLRINAVDMRVGAAAKLNAALHFDDGFASLNDAGVVSDAGWQAQLSKADVTMALVEDSQTAYALDVAIADLTLPDALITQVVDSDALGSRISALRVDATLTLDRGLERLGLDGASPQISRVDLAGADLVWGDVTVQAAGALDIDDAGVPTGQITLKSAQWQVMIDILVGTGALDAGIAPTLTTVANAMAGDDGVLELPIAFRDGAMSMGLLPLGPAPVFR